MGEQDLPLLEERGNLNVITITTPTANHLVVLRVGGPRLQDLRVAS